MLFLHVLYNVWTHPLLYEGGNGSHDKKKNKTKERSEEEEERERMKTPSHIRSIYNQRLIVCVRSIEYKSILMGMWRWYLVIINWFDDLRSALSRCCLSYIHTTATTACCQSNWKHEIEYINRMCTTHQIWCVFDSLTSDKTHKSLSTW